MHITVNIEVKSAAGTVINVQSERVSGNPAGLTTGGAIDEAVMVAVNKAKAAVRA